MITLSPAQERVLAEINAWLDTRPAGFSGRNWRALFGYAGTGKSTLLNKLAQNRRVAFVALTGKAAAVLREKGCANATTLHRTIYRAQERTVRAPDGTERYATEFVARDDNPLKEFDLVVLDEGSMCDARQAQDLLSYGVPVLISGDPFQLPPINGQGYFSNHTPDWLLTEVHRQALDSGILRLATDIREGRGFGANYGADVVVTSMDEAAANEAELLGWQDVVIVGTHRMRHHFNQQCRIIDKRRSPWPEKDEPLVCLANDHRRGLLNGGLWDVGVAGEARTHDSVEVFVESRDEAKTKLLVECWQHDFIGTESELEKLSWQRRSAKARFTWGYALTCHKMQGSSEEKVIVIDESATFREHAANWIYSAITRASKQLVVVR